MPIGTIVNALAVMVGSIVGNFLQSKFPENIKNIVFQAIGLCTIILGITMALSSDQFLLLIFSLIIGGIIGEACSLETAIEKLAQKAKGKNSSNTFSQGLITAFLIFCMGSMTIVGAIEEGLNNNHSILLTKSVLDGFTSIALASTYGIGVFFSAFLVLIIQGGITLLAQVSSHLFTDVLIAQLTAVGGIMLIGLGINVLGIKNIKVLNLLPALLIIVILTVLFL